MSKAIKIEAEKANEGYNLLASKFFGSPVIPEEWDGDFYDDEIFFCQIRLSDIAELDTEGRLPKDGYLYVFLYTEELGADVRYYQGEPNLVVEDFNLSVEGYEKFNDAYLMSFSEAEEDEDCIRLFGAPSDWSYEQEPRKLLMQYDPLASDMGFLDYLDGFVYLFFGEDERDYAQVFIHEEFS